MQLRNGWAVGGGGAVGARCGQHLCAAVKSQARVGIWRTRDARLSHRNSGGRPHVMGIWRGCWGILCARARASQEYWDGRSESMQQ